MFATLNTALVAVTNPNFANNPKAQFIVDKILTATGHISAVELSSIAELQQATNQSVPSGGKVASDLKVEQLTPKQ